MFVFLARLCVRAIRDVYSAAVPVYALLCRIINVPWGLYTFATDVLEEGGTDGKARYVEAGDVGAE